MIKLAQLRTCLLPPPVHCDDLGYTDKNVDRVHVKSNSTIDRVIIAVQLSMIKHLLCIVASVHSEEPETAIQDNVLQHCRTREKHGTNGSSNHDAETATKVRSP